MERLHARYPFLEASREAVEAADVDLAALVAAGGPAVERGSERVRRALLEGTTVTEEPRAYSDRAELLSYPVARVLVSLLDVPGAVEKYAAAESALVGAPQLDVGLEVLDEPLAGGRGLGGGVLFDGAGHVQKRHEHAGDRVRQ